MKEIKYIVFLSTLIIASVFVINGQQSGELPFRNAGLTLEERVNDLVNRLTLEEKAGLLWELSPPIERLEIPKFYHGNEGLHGVVRPGKFTVFPQAIALGATWNPDLIFEVSTAISDEARGRWNELEQGKLQSQYHCDLLTMFSPTINMARDPRWGRTAETYGEDPFLTSRIGVNFVKGLQGDNDRYVKVTSTPKHFVANNEENNRYSCNAAISERTLREYYLPAFKACIVEGKAVSIMSAYNAINWVPCNANRWLLKDLLRDEWGFEGYVVSDCGGVCNLQSSHKFVDDPIDATAASLRAGMDVECNGGCYFVRDYLQSAYEDGRITMEEIDNAVENILRVMFRLGVFDSIEDNPYNQISPEIVGSKKHQDLALKTALQSIVLLKNDDNILPISKEKVQSIAVIGHNADECVFGDYSGVPINDPVSPLQGIKNVAGEDLSINFVSSKLISKDVQMVEAKYLETFDGERGLKAVYYKNYKLEGEGIHRLDAQVDIHSQDNPPDPFLIEGGKSARWEGYIIPPVSGEYNFGVNSDDGVRLWLNDELLIDSWEYRGGSYDLKLINFEAGNKYKLKIEWYDGGGDYTCRLWWKIPGTKDRGYPAEEQAAKKSDVVIAVLGTGLYNEREGYDKEELNLPGDQVAMLKAVAKVNPNIIVVLITGSQHTIPWIKENVPGIVNAWYPGEQGGTAIADVLFGNYSPAGKLPLTYYEDVKKLPEMRRYEISEGRTYMYYSGNPLWEFGFGLSYTTMEFSNLSISNISEDDYISVKLDIKNTGDYDSDEVVQLYLGFPESNIQRPEKQLRAFKRIFVPKGVSKNIELEIKKADLKYWCIQENQWILEDGLLKIMVGSSSRDIRLKGEIRM